MIVRIESDGEDGARYLSTVMQTLKLKAEIEIVPKGSLPNDGLVIEDQRVYD
jgi:phenylacetate-CoA ligase